VIVGLKLSALRAVAPHEYLSRFLLGGAITGLSAWIASRYGPVWGGLFLAFPAIFPASATMLEKHQRARKRRAGITDTIRGRLAAAIEARGAMLGAVALATFAVIAWLGLPRYGIRPLLACALVVWLLLSATLWRLRRLHALWAVKHRNSQCG
jgi:hypothetical protein